jgi:hypothetical protein
MIYNLINEAKEHYMDITAAAEGIAHEATLAAERRELDNLTRLRIEAVRDRCPAYVLDDMRYAIARQEAVVTRLEAVTA